jgi:hypothetical protein
MNEVCLSHVMAGRGPAIHDFTDSAKDMDGRHKGGHDEIRHPARIGASIRPVLNQPVVGQAVP